MHKRFADGSYQPDCRFQTGNGDDDSKQNRSEDAEVLVRDLCQGDAAVVADFKYAATRCTQINQGTINDSHQQHADRSGFYRVLRDGCCFGDAQTLDRRDDDDTESQGGQCVHCVVPFQKAFEECTSLVACVYWYFTRCAHRSEKSEENQNRKKHQKNRIQNLTYPFQYFRGLQGEP